MLKKISLAFVLVIICSGLYAQGEMAKEIMRACETKEGNCLIIDGEEELSLDLAKQGMLRIYLVNEDQKKVDSMRLKIDPAGKYGQITARVEESENILFPTYFFDLIVVKGINLTQGSFGEVYRLLKPGRKGFFVGNYDVDKFLKSTDAPGVKESKVEKIGGLTILERGYERTNKYLKPPLARLWVTCAVQEKGDYGKGTRIKPVKGAKGEIVRHPCLNNVPLDAYTGRMVEPEQSYAKSDCEVESPPYEYWFTSGSGHAHEDLSDNHHGTLAAEDLQTGRLMWTFDSEQLFISCCAEFSYANGVVYKTTHRDLVALDALTGELLWRHRNGLNGCSRVEAARSVLYQPNRNTGGPAPGGFRIQTFISAKEWEQRIPAGDKLVSGKEMGKGETKIRPDDWPMFHYNACRTGDSPDKKIKPPLALAWKASIGGRIRTSPAIVDGTGYLGSCSDQLLAFDAETGKVKWRFFADDEIHSSPCVWQNAVYFGCDDGKVYALDKDSGELLWAYKTDTKASLTPYVIGGSYWPYHGCPRHVSRLKEWFETLKTDKEMAKAYSPSRSFSPLCFNGQPLSTPGVVRSSPLVVDGVLYVGTGLGQDAAPCWGHLYALDARTGKLMWKIGEQDITDHRGGQSSGVANSPCFYDGQVHFSGGTYTAVDARDGKLLLKGGTNKRDFGYQDKLPATYTAPDKRVIQYDEYLAGGDVALDEGTKGALIVSGAKLFAVNMQTGEVKWEAEWTSDRVKHTTHTGKMASIGNVYFQHPVTVEGNRVYLAGGEGIAVFDVEKGGQKAKWQADKPLRELSGPKDFVNTAPAIANGFIYAGSDDGGVYAWKLDGEDKPVWSFATGGKVRSSPAVARGRLYIGSDDGFIYCFGPVKEEPK